MTFYAPPALPWTSSERDDKRFRKILFSLVGLFLILGIVIPRLPVPKVKRQHVELPARWARLLVERQTPRVTEVPKPQPETAKPKTAEAKPEPAPKVEKAPMPKQVEAARRTAARSGLLALKNELVEVADQTRTYSAMASQPVSGGATQVATVDTRILTAESGLRTVKGAIVPQAPIATATSTQLQDNRQDVAKTLLASKSKTVEAQRAGTQKASAGLRGRAEEDVAIVMDKYKGVLDAIYNRKRRSNPGLKGKIVLILTILPNGQVSNITVKSNDLNSPDLEASLLARIRQFNFGASQGGPFTVTVPVEFLPS